MKPLTAPQLKAIASRWLKNNTALTKATTSAVTSMDEIQKQVATDLNTAKKRVEFCAFMQYQFGQDKKVNSNLQTCINKPNTQRYILKVAKSKPLTQRIAIRTANKELLNPKYKLGGKAIVTQKQINQKGVYHDFKWDIPKAKKPTQISKTQAIVIEFDITKEQYIANGNSGKIKFATVD
jgi:hypothetical protein